MILFNAIAVGVPAKVIKSRFDEQTIAKLLEKQWWNGDAEEIKKVKEYKFRVGEYVGSRLVVEQLSSKR